MYIRSKVYHHFNISQNKYKLKLIKGDRAHHILIKGKTYLDVISFLNIYVPRHGHQSLLKKIPLWLKSEMDNRGLQKPTLLNRQIIHIKAKHRTARANL